MAGGAISGYTLTVASRHARIQVPVDPDLQSAITQGRQLVGPNAPASQVVDVLALRGAEALKDDSEAQRRANEFLVTVAAGTSGLDLDRLRSVRERAWR